VALSCGLNNSKGVARRSSVVEDTTDAGTLVDDAIFPDDGKGWGQLRLGEKMLVVRHGAEKKREEICGCVQGRPSA
jgi:hypothetical protein